MQNLDRFVLASIRGGSTFPIWIRIAREDFALGDMHGGCSKTLFNSSEPTKINWRASMYFFRALVSDPPLFVN